MRSPDCAAARTRILVSPPTADSRTPLNFNQLKKNSSAGDLAARLGIKSSGDPRVSALPEFWYAKVLRCLGLRLASENWRCDLLLVQWLTDQAWLGDVPQSARSGPNATEYELSVFPSELPDSSAMRPLAGAAHWDLVPVSAEAACARGGVWTALAKIALHHRVHMVPPFDIWRANGGAQGRAGEPTTFKLNTHAWI